MSGERLIDQARIKAQIEQLQRITKGGEIDVELAMQERKALADRVENRRGAYLTWMKAQGWPQEVIDVALAEFDELLQTLRMEPFSQQSMQLPGLGF